MIKYNILFILVPSFNPNDGGVQMTTFKLASQFSKLGHNVTVFSFSNIGNLNHESFKVIWASKEKGSNNPQNIRDLDKYIDDIRPNVVVNQMPYEWVVSEFLLRKKYELDFFLLACLRNTLFSVRLNIDEYILNTIPKGIGLLFQNFFGRTLFQIIHKFRHAKDLRMILNVYDRFIMFGPQNLDEIRYFIGDFKNEKLEYIPNSIPSILQEIPSKEKVVLYLGRVTRTQKKVELLLPLWKKLMDRIPDWEFWIVGEGDERSEIEFIIQDENIARVRIWGKQDPYMFYEKASFFIMTSSFEGFPNTLIEAQSRGVVPVVMNTYPLLEWLIKDNHNAILIEPYDLDQMANEIFNLILDQERFARIQKNALLNARRFDIDTVGQMWIKLFDKHFKN
ncbi:glycosyltransferase [Cytophagales bacterium LB-30]|uniref:Glycosyltransferase n=1 Tax=Shiella aurantiaca TaxID=3058365 RepID=A0ABT8F823_9BACT|nr:glycosyltransferase [Shiella aurantiaca]MDN4166615.1 glycosyltransferase [Shiella aurantiaca]